MSSIDYLIVILFAVWAMYTGLKNFRKASKSTSEYFLAGRSLSSWEAGFSMAATQFAADTPLLVAGLIASGGISALWRLQIYGLSFLAIAYVFAPMWRRSGVLTDIEITELRYSGNLAFLLRMIKAIHLGTLFNCTVLAMVLLAAGRLFEVFLPWHLWLSSDLFALIMQVTNLLPPFISPNVLIENQAQISAGNYLSLIFIMLFTWGYSTTGGLRSVVKTDVMQLALMFLGTAIYAWILFQHATNGHASLGSSLAQNYNSSVSNRLTSLFDLDMGLIMILVIAVQWIAQVNSDGSGYLAQRILACRSEHDANKACIIFAWTQVVFRSWLWIIIGLSLVLLYPLEPEALGSEVSYREFTFVLGMKDYLPIGLVGIMVTAMLAALASTIDTHLNWGASYWTNDLYHRGICEKVLKRKPSERELVYIARISNILILCLAVLVAVNISNIQSAWKLSLVFGAGFGLVLILRWVWWRITAYCELMAGVGSIITAVLMVGQDDSIVLLAVFGVSTVLVILTALFGPREEMDVLLSFFNKIQPCGFWGPVAEIAGENAMLSRKRLYLSIRKWILMSVALFGGYLVLIKLI